MKMYTTTMITRTRARSTFNTCWFSSSSASSFSDTTTTAAVRGALQLVEEDLLRAVRRRSSYTAPSAALAAVAEQQRQQLAVRSRLPFSSSSSPSTHDVEDGSTASAAPASTDWIPPNRPLSGDQGKSHLYVTQDKNEDEQEEIELMLLEKELKELEEQEAEENERRRQQQQKQPHQKEETVDWLRTRRIALGESESDPLLMTPSEAAKRREDAMEAALATDDRDDVDIDNFLYKLMSSDEIVKCVVASGGIDVVVIKDDPNKPRMGASCDGMVFATAPTHTQLHRIADALVRQLRKRKLDECGTGPDNGSAGIGGIPGATTGPEGNKNGGDDQTWLAVDCHNYVVHVLEETTRKCLRLEDLWSGKDKLHDLNMLDEDAVDDYIESNPVPDEYTNASFHRQQSSSSSSFFNFDRTVKELQKKARYGSGGPLQPAPPSNAIPNDTRSTTRKNKGKKNNRRRY